MVKAMAQAELRSSLVKSSLRRKRSEKYWGILFAMPAILGFLLFTFAPMAGSLVLTFTDLKLINPPKFIGLDNYVKVFGGSDQLFYKSLGTTFKYVLMSVPLNIAFSFSVALLMNKEIKGRAVFRTIFYLPTIVPVFASSMIWIWILDPDLGLLNSILRSVGLPTGMWIYSPDTVIPSLVLMGLWTTGNTMVIFLAGLQGIPRHLYEALEVDGGNSLHKLLYVTIPMMTPTIFFNLIMAFIGGFQVFAEAFIMTQGGPNNASMFIVYYLYREAFQLSNMAYANTVAWVLFVIIVAITFVVFRTSRSWVYYEGEGAK
ncbi:sugar ABC transporter permease [Paenibacillus sp. LC231]|uniref:carbohydrate ABC transporter permease n=1 Tax=Paenibacillus sp. LC231 TaxID=1120679 RepID=UPI001F22E825|nr:sugar ABC transporter permease [Paenibacillus sp. LC231]